MKSIQLFLFAMLCLTLGSCGQHWGGGLWVLPLITIFGFLFFGYRAFVSSKSGSTQQYHTGKREVEGNTINKGYAVFALICLVATIAIVIWVNSEK